jgi:2-(1,2-epoxy-1,2-dihydrophenyl)acetyl-CoA isomerase
LTDLLQLDRADGIAVLTLNRPAALNALNVPLKLKLLAALEEASADQTVRAVIITGAGRGFCAGQDVAERVAITRSEEPAPRSTVVEHYNPIITNIITMPKPVIAAVNGVAAGAGAAIAFACDARIASESGSFVLSFAKVGLTIDSGISWTLPRIIGLARAKSMALFAEPLSSSRALEIGLLDSIVGADELMTTAHELGMRLAGGPTLAYAAIKESMVFGASASLADALALEAELQAGCSRTQDALNAMAAFAAKQKPDFQGR